MVSLGTPVVLFVYNRPETTRRVVDALSKQTVIPPRIIVYADGSRGTQDDAGVYHVSEIVQSIDWTEVDIVKRPENFGCANNIIQGLTAVFKSYNQAVIVEDDVLPGHHFYEAMCILLEKYRDDRDIFSVGGYPSVRNTISEYPCDVILSPRFNAWGWGVWADRWNDISGELKNGEFPFSHLSEVPTNAGTDLPQALVALKGRPGFYWDLPVALICLKKQKLHALTNYYLTNNIGMTSGTHGKASSKLLRFYQENNQIQERIPAKFPSTLDESQNLVSSAIQNYLDTAYRASQVNITFVQRVREWFIK